MNKTMNRFAHEHWSGLSSCCWIISAIIVSVGQWWFRWPRLSGGASVIAIHQQTRHGGHATDIRDETKVIHSEDAMAHGQLSGG